MSSRALAACLLLFPLLAACGDDESGTKPTCVTIGETCHDSESDLGQECHEFGEADATTEEQCQEREEECLGECQ